MSLRDRIQKTTTTGAQHRVGETYSSDTGGQPTPQDLTAYLQERENQATKSDRFEEIKAILHTKLVDNLDVNIDQISHEDMVGAANQLLENYLTAERIPMSKQERDVLVTEILEEMMGYGPLEPLLKDPTISEIMVNGSKNVFIERNGKLHKSNITFRNDAHLLHIIERIVSKVGRRVDEKTPLVDARLKAPGEDYDGSRFNAVIPPLAIDGPSITLRKFKSDAGTLEKLINWGALTPNMAKCLEAAVKSHLNIIISGGTGSGKTTMLNSLSALIHHSERIVTMEDAAELQLKQEHVVRLESRPANIEGTGAIAIRQLLINSLRMRPDRIIVGECRGGETMDMLQAMNTGHDGSLTTLHANTPRDAISRIETMCLMNDHPLPEKAIRQQVSSAVHMIIQVSRLMDGQRKCTSITEITGMEGDTISMQEVFKFEQYGIDDKGKVLGKHVATGVRPKFAEYCKAKGIELPFEIFDKASAGDEVVQMGVVGGFMGDPSTVEVQSAADKVAQAKQLREMMSKDDKGNGPFPKLNLNRK